MRKKLRVGVGVAWRERRIEDEDGDFEKQEGEEAYTGEGEEVEV